jgi:hypothetical protein
MASTSGSRAASSTTTSRRGRHVLTFESEARDADAARGQADEVPRGRSRARCSSTTSRLPPAAAPSAPTRSSSRSFPPTRSRKQDDRQGQGRQPHKGLSQSAHLTIKGVDITAEQRRNLIISLTEADKQNAGERVMLAMLVAGIGESGFLSSRTSAAPPTAASSRASSRPTLERARFLGHQRHQGHGALVPRGREGLPGGRRDQARREANPDATPGTIAYKVEGDRRTSAATPKPRLLPAAHQRGEEDPRRVGRRGQDVHGPREVRVPRRQQQTRRPANARTTGTPRAGSWTRSTGAGS